MTSNFADRELILQLFRLWLGITEYIYRSDELLSECIDTAFGDKSFRADDLEFTFAARVSATTFFMATYFH